MDIDELIDLEVKAMKERIAKADAEEYEKTKNMTEEELEEYEEQMDKEIDEYASSMKTVKVSINDEV